GADDAVLPPVAVDVRPARRVARAERRAGPRRVVVLVGGEREIAGGGRGERGACDEGGERGDGQGTKHRGGSFRAAKFGHKDKGARGEAPPALVEWEGGARDVLAGA